MPETAHHQHSGPDESALQARAEDLRQRFSRLEEALGDGPFFAGSFSLVDAVFGPVFRYFDVFDQIADFGIGCTRASRSCHAS